MRAVSKAAIESEIASRFGSAFKLHTKPSREVLSTGIAEVDALAGGLPRGAITEIFGSASSGRTSLMLSALAHATTHDEICALVDTNNVLDLQSAAHSGMYLERLLWIRCAHNLEHSFKAIDLLLQGGGFGLVVLDLGDVPAKEVRRIISSWWYRFRRVVEDTPTALMVMAQDSCVRSCASLTLELRKETEVWSATSPPVNPFPVAANRAPIPVFNPSVSSFLKAIKFHASRQRPIYPGEKGVNFKVKAL